MEPRGSATHEVHQGMMRMLRYYWKLSRGYRLRPWRSPYLRWRMETFFGPEAEPAGPSRFFSLLWRERRRLREFMDWADAYHRHRQNQ